MSNFSVNPSTFQSMKIGTMQDKGGAILPQNNKEQSFFLSQLSEILSQLVNQVGNPGLVFLSQVTILSPISTNQSVSAFNVNNLAMDIVFTASVTVTLTSLAPGTLISARLVNNSASTFTLKMSCIGYNTFVITGGAPINFTSTGLSFATGIQRMINGCVTNNNVFFSLT